MEKKKKLAERMWRQTSNSEQQQYQPKKSIISETNINVNFNLKYNNGSEYNSWFGYFKRYIDEIKLVGLIYTKLISDNKLVTI